MHQNLDFVANGYNIRGLAYSFVAAFIIYITFFYPPFDSFWEEIDDITYYVLNGTLEGQGTWEHIAAFMNSKLYDALSGIFLIMVLAAFILAGIGKNMNKRMAAVIFMGLYITIVTVVRRKSGFMEYGRDSPSAADLFPFIDLEGLYPQYAPKVSSENSFPSDHGIFCLLFVTFFWFYAGRSWGIAVSLLMPFFLLPRMISGAHWLSDTGVGAVAFVLPFAALAFYTPFAAYCCRKLEAGINAGTRLLPIKHRPRV